MVGIPRIFEVLKQRTWDKESNLSLSHNIYYKHDKTRVEQD